MPETKSAEMSELAKILLLQTISRAEPWKIGNLEPGMQVMLAGAKDLTTDPEIETKNGECGLIALHFALKCLGSDVKLEAIFAAAPELRSGVSGLGQLATPMYQTAGIEYSLDPYMQAGARTNDADVDRVLCIVDELLKGNAVLIRINHLDEYLQIGNNHAHAIAIGGFKINKHGVPIFETFDPAIESDGPVPVSARHLLKNSDPEFFVISKELSKEPVAT